MLVPFPVRVALIDMPRMLNQLVEAALERCGEIAVVANVRESTVFQTASATEFVVAGGDGICDHEIARLLAEQPLIRILVIRDDGRSSVLFGDGARQAPSHEVRGAPIGELSLPQLINLICAARRTRTP